MLSYHPDGLTVDIVGIIASDHGRHYYEHPFCGERSGNNDDDVGVFIAAARAAVNAATAAVDGVNAAAASASADH